MKDPPVANGHREQLVIFASPPADFFRSGLNLLTGFTQQRVLVHHLHHCFRNEGHWTLPKLQHKLRWGIIAFLYQWKHTFPLKLLCFFVPSLCPSGNLKTQAVTRISL